MSFDLEIEIRRHPRRSRKKACPVCGGRGWTKPVRDPRECSPKDEWADPCLRCKGSGAIKSLQLARALGVHRRDVYRVDTLTAGTKIGVRVLDAILRWFPEALT